MKLFSENIWQIVEVSKVVSWVEARSSIETVSGCVEGLYYVEGPYCGEAEVNGCAEEERCVKA